MYTVSDTLEFILKSITPEGTEISIESREEEGVLVLEISAPSEITGQIIGKEGRIIKSIRTLLNISHPTERFIVTIKDNLVPPLEPAA